ncbi:nucleotidyltransferase family protein [Carnobacterium sp.]|uniref:nucleotidyltransferase family protein n=1 Tax=Carnobacterium sp. TaxID=48221 RepID=UPI00388EED52
MEIKEFIVSENTTVKAAMEQMDKNAHKIIYVTTNNEIIGSLSDGDVRRYILKNQSIQNEVIEAMNPSPIFIFKDAIDKGKKLMEEKKIDSIPVLNDDNSIRNILFKTSESVKGKKINPPVVIMAGGKGTRLYPYTKILPKPLIPIGDTPIMERIIERFYEYGCKNFVISVNYKKNMIKSYFNEEIRDYKLTYIEEDKPLGTGGSLSLMREYLKETFFVSNCDILVDTDYTAVMDYHKQNKNDITFIASIKNTQIPYGVLKLDNEGLLESTVEKPEYSHLINTGMYLIEPVILEFVSNGEFADLPNVIMKAKDAGFKVGVFPVSENAWLDMGQIKEMENMIDSLGVR